MDGNTWYTYLIYSIIVIFAFFGNCLVLYVFFTKCSHLRKISKMFICNLAIADIITSLMLVFSRFLYLPPMPANYTCKEIYCKTIWAAWILFTLGYISIYTCLALAFERWLAVIMPFYYCLVRPSQIAKAIVLVWIVGATVNVTTLFRAKYDHEKGQCTWTSLNIGNNELPWLDFVLQSIIPFTIIVILYSHILHSLRRRSSKDSLPAYRLKRITQMTMAASSALIIGWLPSRVSFLLSKFGYVDPNGLFHYCLVMFSFCNSSVNPFIYSAYSRHFRRDCREIFSNAFVICTGQRSSVSPARNGNTNPNAITLS